LAEQVRGEKRRRQARCEEILTALLRGEEDLPASVAVATALLARYYKRVEAHLGNIVDILVTPVSEGGLAIRDQPDGQPAPGEGQPSSPVTPEGQGAS
jgi:hypothetical protein